MCGIAGFYNPKNEKDSDDDKKNFLAQMTDSLRHRGPDGTGLWSNTDVYLGHRRLSIIDLSDLGNQPFTFKHLHLVFNGEIYNYAELQAELRKQGYSFASNSDTEVVLKAIHYKGLRWALEQFVGMFAIALYDENLQQLTLVRDRMGVKPLYYYHDVNRQTFLFASELRAFLRYPHFKKEINPHALESYFNLAYVAGPETIYRDCYKLTPGHLLVFDREHNQSREELYWKASSFYDDTQFDLSEEQVLKELEFILSESARARLVADVDVGVFLSGGYDSTAVTALLARATSSSQKLKTFTIGFHEPEYNEAPQAKKIARYLDTDHHELYCSAQDALAMVPLIPKAFDEPFADSSAIPTMLVSRFAAKYVKVALSADGGDELFGGYNKYDMIRKVKKLSSPFPLFVRQGCSSFLKQDFIASLAQKHLAYNGETRLRKIADLLATENADDYVHKISAIFHPAEMARLLSSYSQHQGQNHVRKNTYGPMSFMNQMMLHDLTHYMVDDILVKVDRATMFHGLEGREPLLDRRLVEFLGSIPSSLKMKNGIKKYLLKKIVHQMIPEQFLSARKKGFSAPLEMWFRKDLKALVLQSLSSENLRKHGFLENKAVEKLLSDFYSGKKGLEQKIWTLLMFQLWFEEWK